MLSFVLRMTTRMISYRDASTETYTWNLIYKQIIPLIEKALRNDENFILFDCFYCSFSQEILEKLLKNLKNLGYIVENQKDERTGLEKLCIKWNEETFVWNQIYNLIDNEISPLIEKASRNCKNFVFFQYDKFPVAVQNLEKIMVYLENLNYMIGEECEGKFRIGWCYYLN